MRAEEAERFQKAVQAGISVPDDDACWAMNTIMKTAGELDSENKANVLRSLASL